MALLGCIILASLAAADPQEELPLSLRKKFGYMESTSPVRIKSRPRSAAQRSPALSDPSSHLQHRSGHHRTGLEAPVSQQVPSQQSQQTNAEDRFFLIGRKRPFKRPRPQSHYGAPPPKKRPLFKKPSFKKPSSHRPSPQYGAPAPSYQAPAEQSYEAPYEPSYEAPSPSYEAADTYGSPVDEPEDTYNAPEQSYEAPSEPSYSAPEPSYNAPAEPSYTAPEPSYNAPAVPSYTVPEPSYVPSFETVQSYSPPADEPSSYGGSGGGNGNGFADFSDFPSFPDFSSNFDFDFKKIPGKTKF